MKVITLCGSYKFKNEMAEVAEIMTLAGNCVLTPNELTRDSKDDYTEEESRMIDMMHKEKIRLSDAIIVVNVGGYVGKSTQSEIDFAEGLGKEIKYYTDLVESGVVPIPHYDLYKQWLTAFGKGADLKDLADHVLSSGNCLWHLFSYDYVPSLDGKAAKRAFDKLKYTEAIRFSIGFSERIEDVCEIGKLSAKELDDSNEWDVYIVAKDFSWTYVRTHERDYCGPYFCKLK